MHFQVCVETVLSLKVSGSIQNVRFERIIFSSKEDGKPFKVTSVLHRSGSFYYK